jgi:hypothetical protein
LFTALSGDRVPDLLDIAARFRGERSMRSIASFMACVLTFFESRCLLRRRCAHHLGNRCIKRLVPG